MSTSALDPFPLPGRAKMPRWLSASLTRYLCLDRAAEDCAELAGMASLREGLEPTLGRYSIDSRTLGACAAAVPKHGPVLVTADHPTGILDGVVVMAALLQRRDDVYVLANRHLETIPHFANHHIPIDKGADASAPKQALRGIRRVWKGGGCVVHFPAGTVAHWQRKSWTVTEAPAEKSVQRLAERLNVSHLHATLYLENPASFHAVAAVSRFARTALLIRVFYTGSRIIRHPPVALRAIERNIPPGA